MFHTRIKPPLTILDWILEIAALITVIATIVLFVLVWLRAPDIVPIHYNFAGHADTFGNKSTLWVLPDISLITYIGLTILNCYPHIFNFPTKVTPENAATLYKIATRVLRIVKLLVGLMFLWVVWYEYWQITTPQINNSLNTVFIIVMSGWIASIFICLVWSIYKMIRIGNATK